MAFPEDILSSIVDYSDTTRLPGLLVELVTAPWDEPVSLAETKEHNKINALNTRDDVKIGRQIAASRILIENITNLSMMETAWKQTYNNVYRELEMYQKPMLSVTSIESIPNFQADALVPFAASSYVTSGQFILARTVWPVHRGWKSFVVTYKAGYASKGTADAAALLAARNAVPSDLREAVMGLAGHMYENLSGEGASVTIKGEVEKFGALPGFVLEMIDHYIDRNFRL